MPDLFEEISRAPYHRRMTTALRPIQCPRCEYANVPSRNGGHCGWCSHQLPHVPVREAQSCDRCGRFGYRDDRQTFALRRNGQPQTTCRACRRAVRATRERVARHGRRFGVEIEFVLEREVDSYYGGYSEAEDPHVITRALARAGIECFNEGYTHEVMDCWKIVSDASVANGWELVSPPLFWHEREQVATVCDVLQSLGADADEQCGLHVHHEVADLSLGALKRLVRGWHETQHLTDRLVAPERCGQTDWCSPFRSREVDAVLAAQDMAEFTGLYHERYRSLNLTALPKYGTVEIRQHQGTLDADAILAWVAYGQAVVQQAVSRTSVKRNTVREYVDTLPIKCEQSKAELARKARERQPSFAF